MGALALIGCFLATVVIVCALVIVFLGLRQSCRPNQSSAVLSNVSK